MDCARGSNTWKLRHGDGYPAAASGQGRPPIADVLARHTTQGRYVRQVLKRMAMLNIDSSLRVGQGRPAWQVRHEVARKTYDLVITSIEPAGRLLNRHLERLIEPLQHWTSAPILVARFPTTWLGKP